MKGDIKVLRTKLINYGKQREKEWHAHSRKRVKQDAHCQPK